MTEVYVTVTYAGSKRVDLALPWKVPVVQVLEGILSAFGLSRIPNHKLILALLREGKFRQINEDVSMAAAGVLVGDCLELFAWNQAYLLSVDGQKFPLKDTMTTIGRTSPEREVDLDLSALDKPMLVSRRHGTIRHEHNQYYLKDENSRNGILINGLKLPPDHYHQLQEGDLIQFGGTQGIGLIFHYQLV